MKLTTADGARLKRLVEKYARAVSIYSVAFSDCWHSNSTMRELRNRKKTCRKKLYAEIDRLTQVDITPRAVQEM